MTRQTLGRPTHLWEAAGRQCRPVTMRHRQVQPALHSETQFDQARFRVLGSWCDPQEIGTAAGVIFIPS